MPNPENLKKRKSFTKNDPRINRNGRPPKLPELDVLLSDKVGGKGIEAIVLSMLKRAKKGDVRAAELLLNRGYGKAKEFIETTFKDETKRVIKLPGGIEIET